jgi:hypothetical protein
VADRAKLRLADNSLQSVAAYLMRIFDTVGRGQDGFSTPVQMNDKRVVITVARCPLNFDLPAMCQAHTTMEKTVVETLNPALTYRIGKSIPAGDSVCEHILEVK